MKQSGFWWNNQKPWITILSIISIVIIVYVGCGCVRMKTDVGLQSKLTDAIREGSFEEVSSILNSGASPERYDSNIESPLETAVIWNQPEIVLLLIESGAKASRPDEFGVTPLMYAVRSGHLDVVRILLKAGSDPFWKTPNTDISAFHIANAIGRESILQELLRYANLCSESDDSKCTEGLRNDPELALENGPFSERQELEPDAGDRPDDHGD